MVIERTQQIQVRVNFLDRNLLEANFFEMSAKYQISKQENIQVLQI